MAQGIPLGGLSRRGVLTLVSLLLCVGLVAPTTLFIAIYPLGNSFRDDASACQAAAEVSGSGVLVDQDTPATAERSWFPPTVVCSVDVHRDGHPAVTVHRHLVASAFVLMEGLAVVVVLVRLIVAMRVALRPRGRRNRAPVRE